MITFNSIELKNVKEGFDQAPEVKYTDTVLAAGTHSIQVNSEVGFKRTFECSTDTYSDISSLLALVGTAYTLVIDGVTYTNCYLIDPKNIYLDAGGTWWYTVSFVRDTTP